MCATGLSAFRLEAERIKGVKRYHTSHDIVGISHLYQGRYKSFPVQNDSRYLSVLRYIEANPVRAGMVRHGSLWLWSSFTMRQGRGSAVLLNDGPVGLPSNWPRLVRAALDPADFSGTENSIRRGAPIYIAPQRNTKKST